MSEVRTPNALLAGTSNNHEARGLPEVMFLETRRIPTLRAVFVPSIHLE